MRNKLASEFKDGFLKFIALHCLSYSEKKKKGLLLNLFIGKEAGENKFSKVFGAYRTYDLKKSCIKKKINSETFLKYKYFIPLFGTF